MGLIMGSHFHYQRNLLKTQIKYAIFFIIKEIFLKHKKINFVLVDPNVFKILCFLAKFEYFSEHALTYRCFEFFEQVRIRSFGTVFGARKCDSIRGLWKIMDPKPGPRKSTMWVDVQRFI